MRSPRSIIRPRRCRRWTATPCARATRASGAELDGDRRSARGQALRGTRRRRSGGAHLHRRRRARRRGCRGHPGGRGCARRQDAHQGSAAARRERAARAVSIFASAIVLLERGRRISPRDVALLAAGDFAHVEVTRKPRVAVVATGDELTRPGEPRAPGGIVASSTYALQAMIANGAASRSISASFPIARKSLRGCRDAARGMDLIITLGGASVGDHDLIQSALAPHGFVLDFWKIAMRPGKPLIFGRLNATPLIGLPGNPGVRDGLRAAVREAGPLRDARRALRRAGADRAPGRAPEGQWQAPGLHPRAAVRVRRHARRRAFQRFRIPRCRRSSPRPMR